MKATEHIENYIIGRLPAKLSCAYYDMKDRHPATPNEIRIRAGHNVTVHFASEIVPLDCTFTGDEVDELTFSLCDSSIYSYADTIRCGYITMKYGIRVGIVGHAVVENGIITAVRSFSSLAIRLPKRVPNAGKAIADALDRLTVSPLVVVYSPPGIGKSTALREYCATETNRKVAVVDTRSELAFAAKDGTMCDILDGYPRAQGIEIALRSLSPDVIVTDEIGSDDDRNALRISASAGVAVVASVHADSLDSAVMRALGDCKTAVPSAFIGLSRQNGEVVSRVDYL